MMSKVAAVVGVGPGIGRAVCEKFAREGYAIALMSRTLEKMQPVIDSITAQGGTALAFPADATNEQSIREAFQQIRERMGAPEVLVFNAASSGAFTWPPPGVLETSPDKLKGALFSVVGALVCSQEVAGPMLANHKGTIIFTGATGSLRGGARFALLSTPKFALRSLGQSLARELQPNGIHVAHVIVDGAVGDVGEGNTSDKQLAPEAIADTYWFLHTQHRSAWTHELDLRPDVEKF